MSAFKELILAHALQFERPERARYDAAAGTRLLLAFVLVGLVLQPGLRALARAAGFAREFWVGPAMVVTLTIAVILAVRGLARLGTSAIGLHRWAAWTPRERIYALTVVPLAAVAFAIVFREQFARLAETQGWLRLLALTIPTGLLWGMVQEFIYRGLLQTDLVRRFGGIIGVLLANIVFTFGPLHFKYLALGAEAGPHWNILAAIFGIGLLFGVLYQRSGNLWISAIMHGLWPPNMV
jgi:membrane protease YdiL (CAAX protease family)